MNSNSNNNISEYSNAKIIITILVVIGHITRMYTPEGAIHLESNMILMVVTNIIYFFHMPMFIFLSGAIYSYCLSLGKYKNYKSMVKNKFKRLLIPYFFWGILYVAPVVVFLKITQLNYIKYVLVDIILGADPRHLWYLFSLFIIFCIVGVIDKIINRNWNNKVMIFLFIVTSIISYFSNVLPTILCINYIMRYICFFIFGMFINFNRKSILDIYNKYNYKLTVILLLGFCLCFFIRKYFFIKFLGAIFGILLIYCIVLFLDGLMNSKKFISILKSNAMGIYIY